MKSSRNSENVITGKRIIRHFQLTPQPLKVSSFLYDLLEQRREFGCLSCVLADVERRKREAQEREYEPNAVYYWGGSSQAPEPYCVTAWISWTVLKLRIKIKPVFINGRLIHAESFRNCAHTAHSFWSAMEGWFRPRQVQPLFGSYFENA